MHQYEYTSAGFSKQRVPKQCFQSPMLGSGRRGCPLLQALAVSQRITKQLRMDALSTSTQPTLTF